MTVKQSSAKLLFGRLSQDYCDGGTLDDKIIEMQKVSVKDY